MAERNHAVTEREWRSVAKVKNAHPVFGSMTWKVVGTIVTS